MSQRNDGDGVDIWPRGQGDIVELIDGGQKMDEITIDVEKLRNDLKNESLGAFFLAADLVVL